MLSFLFGISLLSLFADTAPDSSDIVPPSETDPLPSTSPPADPQASRLVLERLVPSKKFKSVPLLRATMKVPRPLFLPKELAGSAYSDLPLPLGSGETLFPPFDTVYALEQLRLQPTDRVWIVGVGTGYAAAIASQLAKEIEASELSPSLVKRGNEAFKELGLKNIRLKSATPEQILKETPKFNKILFTVSFPHSVPDNLAGRLEEGGTMIVPLGSPDSQRLFLIQKDSEVQKTLPLIGICPTRSFRGISPEEQQLPDILLDESFEPAENSSSDFAETLPGWFDLRNASLCPDKTAPEGNFVLEFDSHSVRLEQRRKDAIRRQELSDQHPEKTDLDISPLTLRQRAEERTTLAVRAFPLNGKKIHKIKVSCCMEGIGIQPESQSQLGVITLWLAFFDDNRVPLHEIPLVVLKKGNTDWNKFERESLPIPKRTREAEIRLGILDGYGILKVDALKIEKAGSSLKKN